MGSWPEPFPCLEVRIEVSKLVGDLTLAEGGALCDDLMRETRAVLEKHKMVACIGLTPLYDQRVSCDAYEGFVSYEAHL